MVGAFGAIAVRSALPGWGPLALVLLLTAVAAIGVVIMRRGRKLSALRGDQYLAGDPRPPVVYLRPFASDEEGAGVLNSWLLLRPGYFTEEEQLATVLNEIGPFVAIGDPAESLPDLGAARIYASDDDWQVKVRDLLSRAALVILRPGTSEGFWWEFRLVRDVVSPERLLLLVPDHKAVYSEFRRRAEDVLPHPLPEYPEGKRLMSRTRTIVAFEANWRSWPLPVAGSFRRTPFTSPYLARVKLTMKPIFARLGAPWVDPPVARRRMVMLVTASVITALSLLLWAAIVLPEYFYTPPADFTTVADTGTAAPEKDAYDRAVERMGARTQELPEFRDALKSAKDPASARTMGRELSAKGLRRLDDETLIRRSGIMLHILTLADTTTCAAITRGEPAPGLEAIMRRLAPEEIDHWFDVSFAAMAAEVRQSPDPPAASQAEIDRLVRTLLSGLPSDDRKVLASVLIGSQDISVEDTCRGGRLLYQRLGELPPRSHATLARALVTR
jgi:hypothetical protein